LPVKSISAIAGSTASANIGGADVISLAITTDRLLTSLVVNSTVKNRKTSGKAIGIAVLAPPSIPPRGWSSALRL
jgi:hypothetical protein